MVVLAVYALRSVAGAFLVPWVPSSPALLALLGAVITMLMSVMVVYLLNGISDINQDRENNSKRPLASGTLTIGQARGAIVGLVVGILIVSPVLPVAVTRCNFLMLTLGVLYSLGPIPAKMHSSAGLAVAGAGAVLPYISSVAAVNATVDKRVMVTAILLGCWVWAGGPAKDLGDVRGDEFAGRRTLPVRFGTQQACSLIVIRISIVALLSGLLAILQLASPALLLTPLCAAIVAPFALRDHSWKRSFHLSNPRRLYRVFMVSQFALNGALIVASAVV